MSGSCIVSLRQVSKTYHMGESVLNALNKIDFEVHEGEYVAIMGPSGCGKSTLLNVLGCLDKPTQGSYLLGGKDVSLLNDDALSDIRGSHLGFIFQSYNLIQQLNVLENIELPLYYQGRSAAESRAMALVLAERVGLGNRAYHKPMELSGGQQQRVGIARALVNNPLLLLADEPTGNLDTGSGKEILSLIDELRIQGKTIIVVTHDPDIGERADRIVRLRDGRIEEDLRHGRS
jgi:putative ABC transport system ATP-binding protein